MFVNHLCTFDNTRVCVCVCERVHVCVCERVCVFVRERESFKSVNLFCTFDKLICMFFVGFFFFLLHCE